MNKVNPFLVFMLLLSIFLGLVIYLVFGSSKNSFFSLNSLSILSNNTDQRQSLNLEDIDENALIKAFEHMQSSPTENHFDVEEFGIEGVTKNDEGDFVIYEISLINEQGKKKEIKVNIANGLLTLNEKIEEDHSFFERSRSFSLPTELDLDKAEVKEDQQKIIVKIPKK